MEYSVASGDISQGSLYSVTGGTILYNSISYTSGTTFRGTTVTTFSVSSGAPIVVQISEVRTVSVQFLPNTVTFGQPSQIRSVSATYIGKLVFGSQSTISSVSITKVDARWSRMSRRIHKAPSAPSSVVNKDITAIFTGQSNMVGVGGDIPMPVVGSYGREYDSLSGTLHPVGDTTGDFRGSFAAEYSPGYGLQNAFINRYHDLSGKNVDMVKHARHGSLSIAWASALSTESIGYIQEHAGLFTYEKIIVHFQGESEASDIIAGTPAATVRDYLQRNTLNMIKNYRAAFGATTKIFIIKVGYRSSIVDAASSLIAQYFNEMAESIPYVYICADARKYNSYKNADGLHFGQQGLNLIGTEAAEGVYNVLSKQ